MDHVEWIEKTWKNDTTMRKRPMWYCAWFWKVLQFRSIMHHTLNAKHGPRIVGVCAANRLNKPTVTYGTSGWCPSPYKLPIWCPIWISVLVTHVCYPRVPTSPQKIHEYSKKSHPEISEHSSTKGSILCYSHDIISYLRPWAHPTQQLVAISSGATWHRRLDPKTVGPSVNWFRLNMLKGVVYK